uniref:Integrin beta n=1 Tax=Oryzias melastigma TaxID=30732 RepID=A0A3B3C8U9_ORYME
MTSWLRSCASVPLCVLLACTVWCAEASSAGASVCWSPGVTSCSDCLRRGPQCAWCFKEDFLNKVGPSHRCDLPENLLRRGCGPDFMELSEIKVEVDGLTRSQVSPSHINITLRPGSEVSFIVAVTQLERYPVDLYYLVDVSASMQENLDNLKTVGVALSLRMMQHTSDLWLGFGSFVDKPVSPYINVHPSKINNPCSDYEIRCRPAHGFHHVLSMTGNLSEFTRTIKRQRISGNMDTPEGGLDAMLQAAVCQDAIGWRSEAKRLLLLMTDQPSHLALDSRLAGIVVPHDGLCHLENNVYTGSTKMDHPSLGQLSEKLLENRIYSVFAVEKQRYQWYERLLSEVLVSVSVEDEAVSRYWVSVSPLCPDGSTAKGRSCTGVQPNQTVYFNITIGQHSCADDGRDEDVRVIVRPVGYNESTVVRIHSKCHCSCGATGHCHEDEQLPCQGIQDGATLQQDLNADPSRSCRATGADVDCSGRGTCVCGRCVCDQARLGTVQGKYCEIDDFSCPYKGELICAGRGVCVLGQCVCEDGWTGEDCGCPLSTTTCYSNGLLCNGQGKCVCGKCVCDEHQRHGDFCEKCPTCPSTWQSYCESGTCLQAFGLSQREVSMVSSTDNASESGSGHLVRTFLSVCALTVLCGLMVVAVSRLLLLKRGRSQGGSEDGGYRCTGKDLSYIPTTNEKTVTYRRDRPPEHPLEMHIQVPKMAFGDPWQC